MIDENGFEESLKEQAKAFEKEKKDLTLGEYLAQHGLTTFQVSKLTGTSRQTLMNWHKYKKDLLECLAIGVSSILNSKKR